MRYVIPTSSRPIIIDEPDHPALADPEGIALVKAIHDRKARGEEHATTNPAEAD